MLTLFDRVIRDAGLVLLIICTFFDIIITVKILFVRALRSNSTTLTVANVTLNHGIFILISISSFFRDHSDYCTKLFIQFITACGIVFFIFMLVLIWSVKNYFGEPINFAIRHFYWTATGMFYLTAFIMSLMFFGVPCDYSWNLPDFMESFVFNMQVFLVVVVLIFNTCLVRNDASKRVNLEIFVANIYTVFISLHLIIGFLLGFLGQTGERELSFFMAVSAFLQTSPIFIYKYFRTNEKFFAQKNEEAADYLA